MEILPTSIQSAIMFNSSMTPDQSKQCTISTLPSKRTVLKREQPEPEVPTTKTGLRLLHKAAANAKSFAGKFAFGLTKAMISVLPPPLPPIHQHRDELFPQGEKLLPFPHRKLPPIYTR